MKSLQCSTIWCGNVPEQWGTNNSQFSSLCTHLFTKQNYSETRHCHWRSNSIRIGSALVKLFLLTKKPLRKYKRRGYILSERIPKLEDAREWEWTRQRELRRSLPGTQTRGNGWCSDRIAPLELPGENKETTQSKEE